MLNWGVKTLIHNSMFNLWTNYCNASARRTFFYKYPIPCVTEQKVKNLITNYTPYHISHIWQAGMSPLFSLAYFVYIVFLFTPGPHLLFMPGPQRSSTCRANISKDICSPGYIECTSDKAQHYHIRSTHPGEGK